MKRTDLEAMGLTKEQVDSIMSTNGADIENAKSAYQKEIDSLTGQIGDRDKQLADLKKTAGDNEILTKQISELQKTNAEQKKAHDAEIAQLKLDNAIDAALAAAGARNTKAVKALLDVSKVTLGDDGNLSGWDDQLSAVQKSDSYLFAGQNTEKGSQFRGFQPGAGGSMKPDTEVDTSKMTYSEMLAYKAANPEADVDF